MMIDISDAHKESQVMEGVQLMINTNHYVRMHKHKRHKMHAFYCVCVSTY